MTMAAIGLYLRWRDATFSCRHRAPGPRSEVWRNAHPGVGIPGALATKPSARSSPVSILTCFAWNSLDRSPAGYARRERGASMPGPSRLAASYWASPWLVTRALPEFPVEPRKSANGSQSPPLRPFLFSRRSS